MKRMVGGLLIGSVVVAMGGCGNGGTTVVDAGVEPDADDWSFAAPVMYPTRIQPIEVVAGDLDGDGKPDLAVTTCEQAGKVSVWINHGDGSFAAPVSYGSGGICPGALTMVNVDGVPGLDLVVSHTNDEVVSVLLNQGHGTFTNAPPPTLLSDVPGRAVAAADFDGDGRADLAIANRGLDSVSVLLGNGDGTFAAQVPYGTGDRPGAIAVANLGGDVKPDLVVTGNGVVSVLVNQGNGAFAAAVTYPIGTSSNFVTIADLNGDTKADLIVSNSFGGVGTNTVSVLLNQGDGTFAAQVAYPTGDGPSRVVLVDPDRNGKPDLAMTNFRDDTMSVLLNHGDGTFGAQVSRPAGQGASYAVTADLDGDRALDVAVVSAFDDTLRVFLDHGDGTLAAPLMVPSATGCTGCGGENPVVSDLDGDGKSDVVVVNLPAASLSVLLHRR